MTMLRSASRSILERSEQAARLGRAWAWEDHRKLAAAIEQVRRLLESALDCFDVADDMMDPDGWRELGVDDVRRALAVVGESRGSS